MWDCVFIPDRTLNQHDAVINTTTSQEIENETDTTDGTRHCRNDSTGRICAPFRIAIPTGGVRGRRVRDEARTVFGRQRKDEAPVEAVEVR